MPLALTPVTPTVVSVASVSGASFTSVQNAVNAVTAPGIVQLGQGTYTGSSQLSLKAGVSLRGQGIDVTTLNYTGSGDAVTYAYATGPNAIDSVVENLTVTSSSALGAGLNFTNCGRVQVRNVVINGHAYGVYCDFGESNWFQNVIFNSPTVAAVYLTGVSTAAASNNNLFDNCWFVGGPIGVQLNKSNYLNVFNNCRFYSITNTGVYIPSAATDVTGNRFENCWWEGCTKNNDLRAGTDTVYVGPHYAGSSSAFIESVNYGAKRTKIVEPMDVSGSALFSNAIDVELIGDGGVSEVVWQQILGSHPSSSRDSSYLPSLGVRGLTGGPVGFAGWGNGAGEKNLIPTVTLTDAGSWVSSGGLTGSIADPLNGTGAYRVTAGNNVYVQIAAGSALAGRTFTVQVWAKSSGGSVRLYQAETAVSAEAASKYVRLPVSQWTPLSFTYTFTSAATGSTLQALFSVIGASVDLYWPVVVAAANTVPWLPAARDMSGWAGPYEVFGPLHNIRVYVNNTAPAAGTWAVGDEAINYAPVAGGTDRWRCTTAGAPGTWKAVAVAA